MPAHHLVNEHTSTASGSPKYLPPAHSAQSQYPWPLFGLRWALRAGSRAGSGSGSGSGSGPQSSIPVSVTGGNVAGAEAETMRETLVTQSKGGVRDETKIRQLNHPWTERFYLPSMSVINRNSFSASVSGAAAQTRRVTKPTLSFDLEGVGSILGLLWMPSKTPLVQF